MLGLEVHGYILPNFITFIIYSTIIYFFCPSKTEAKYPLKIVHTRAYSFCPGRNSEKSKVAACPPAEDNPGVPRKGKTSPQGAHMLKGPQMIFTLGLLS